MAEPLKNNFGIEVPARIAASLAVACPTFDTDAFVADCTTGYEQLELTDRAKHIATAMADHLPGDRADALDIVLRSLDQPPDISDLGATGETNNMSAFVHLPAVYFVADHGLDHFDQAMELQHRLTQLFTAEFSIRAYLIHHEARTLDVLNDWVTDPSEHVRRLVSEGTRPRLPWAARLPRFQNDPTPVIALLDHLVDDPSEYVRRSVANNMNDIAKDHPDLAVEVCRRWWDGSDPERVRLVRHALRTLIKAADPGALEVIGYGESSPVTIASASIEPFHPAIGDKVTVTLHVENPSTTGAGALVDIRVHFVKKDGSTRPRVFKGGEVSIEPGHTAQIRKTISMAQQSTRTHHPGMHKVEAIINGRTEAVGQFELAPAPDVSAGD